MITQCSYKKGEKIMNVLLLITPKSKVEYLQNDFSIRQSLEKMDYHTILQLKDYQLRRMTL